MAHECCIGRKPAVEQSRVATIPVYRLSTDQPANLMFIRPTGWMVLLARPAASQDAELLMLRHDVALLRRQDPRSKVEWVGQTVLAALALLPPGRCG